jgi:hypothetical protein
VFFKFNHLSFSFPAYRGRYFFYAAILAAIHESQATNAAQPGKYYTYQFHSSSLYIAIIRRTFSVVSGFSVACLPDSHPKMVL